MRIFTVSSSFGSHLYAQKELHECVQHIQEPVTLREHVTAMYRTNVNAELPRSEMDANIIHEYHRHKVSACAEMHKKGGGKSWGKHNILRGENAIAKP